MATLKKTRKQPPRKKPVVRPGTRRRPGTGAVIGTTVAAAGATAPVVPVAPVAPASSRRRAEKLVQDVTRLRADIAANFYRMGLALRDLSRPEAYRALGYATFADLLEARELVSRITAFKLITIVDNLPQPIARRLGVEKSYGAIRYAQLVHPDRDVLAVIRTDPAIRVSDERIPLSLISSRTLDAALRALRATEASAVDTAKRAQRTARSLAQRLDHAGIDPDRVRSLRRGNGWRIRIDLTIEEAEDLSRFLSGRHR